MSAKITMTAKKENKKRSNPKLKKTNKIRLGLNNPIHMQCLRSEEGFKLGFKLEVECREMNFYCLQ